jgi:hypothetical protein
MGVYVPLFTWRLDARASHNPVVVDAVVTHGVENLVFIRVAVSVESAPIRRL